MTLRERLVVLAETFPPYDYASQHDYAEAIALAAARMALEEAEKAMDSGDVVDWVEAGAAIRALRDGLEDK